MKTKSKVTIITADDPDGFEFKVVTVAKSDPFSALLREDATELVVVDTSSVFGSVLKQWLGDGGHRAAAHDMIAALLPEAPPTSAAVEQLNRNAHARWNFLKDFASVPSAELASLAGIDWSNPAQWASRMQKEGRIFSVDWGTRHLFPVFQFDHDSWEPRAGLAETLGHLAEAGLKGWSLALWWSAANGWLDSKRPADVLAEDPEPVVAAAKQVGHFPF